MLLALLPSLRYSTAVESLYTVRPLACPVALNSVTLLADAATFVGVADCGPMTDTFASLPSELRIGWRMSEALSSPYTFYRMMAHQDQRGSICQPSKGLTNYLNFFAPWARRGSRNVRPLQTNRNPDIKNKRDLDRKTGSGIRNFPAI